MKQRWEDVDAHYELNLEIMWCFADDWSLGYTPISGDEAIHIGGQRLKVISAPVAQNLFSSLLLASYKFHWECSSHMFYI